MGYKICTFDSDGKILSVSPETYPSESTFLGSPALYSMPGAFGLVEESLLPPDTVLTETLDGSFTPLTTGEESFKFSDSSTYDPRVEVTLFMENPQQTINRNTRVIQDITKAVPVFNQQDPTTRPKHDNSVFICGSGSCKFTRSLTGYTGGFIHITNLSKRNQTGGATAPHNDIAKGGTFSYAVEMYFYPTSTANNFTLVQKGPTGASANWKISFDSSAGQLQFAWQTYGTTAGYDKTENIVNTAGLTVNQWHHIAVALVRNGAGVCYAMSGYFNHANKFLVSVTAGSFPETRGNGGLFLGNNPAGTESFDGYIDNFRLLESTGTAGVFGTGGYGFLPFGGGTLAGSTVSGFTISSETAVIMHFDGVSGSSNFFAESTDYIRSYARRITSQSVPGSTFLDSTELGVSDVVRYALGIDGATGLSDATGFSTNYGAIVRQFYPVGGTGYTGPWGYDHCFALHGVYDNNPSLDTIVKNYTNDSIYEYGFLQFVMIEGASGNRGSSGSPLASQFGQNPYRRLFSGGAGNCYGGANAYTALFIDPTNRLMMSYIMENGYLITQGISQASYSFVDGMGITRNISPTEMSNLRLDLLEYQSKNKEAFDSLTASLKTAGSKSSAKISRFLTYAKKTGEYLGTNDGGSNEVA